MVKFRITSTLLSAVCISLVAMCGMPLETSAKVVKLRYMTWGASWLDDAIKDFNRTHSDIQVKAEQIGWDGYFEKVAVIMAGGAAPDMFVMIPGYYEAYAKRGLCLDLTPYVRADRKEMKLDNFYKEAIDICKIDGKYMAIPFGWNVNAFLLNNPKMLSEAGMEGAKSTWDLNDLLNAAKKLTRDRNGDGKLDTYGMANPWGFWPDMVFNSGSDLFDKTQKKLVLDNENAIRALEWQQELATKYKVEWPGGAWDEICQGKVAFMQVHTPGVIDRALAAGKRKVELDVTLWPKDPVSGLQRFRAYNDMVCVSKSTKNPQAVWEFLSWLNGPKGFVAASNRTMGAPQQTPPLRSVANSDTFLNANKNLLPGIDMRVLLEGAENHSFFLSFQGGYDKAMGLLSENWVPVQQGKTTVERFIAKVTPLVNQVLARSK